MVRSFRRGAVAAVIALSLAPLAACASGNGSQTLHVRPDSPETSKGPIKVQNAFVLTQTSGPATITARLFNNSSSDQTLQAVQLSGGLSATLSAANGGGSVTVPAHGTVLLGGTGNPSAVLNTGAQSLQNGGVQDAVFVFSGTGPVALPLNVLPAAGYFESYGPSTLPTTPPPAPSTAPTAKPGSNPSAPGAGATPTGGTPAGSPAKATPTGTAAVS